MCQIDFDKHKSAKYEKRHGDGTASEHVRPKLLPQIVTHPAEHKTGQRYPHLPFSCQDASFKSSVRAPRCNNITRVP